MRRMLMAVALIVSIMAVKGVQTASAEGIGYFPSEVTVTDGLRGQRYTTGSVIINQTADRRYFRLSGTGDIGPWLQVIKLKGLKEEAERAGRFKLSGAEIELMNLAGPRTGLEMMDPIARTMPTANFFSQTGYYRNTIVREKTAAELLAALDERMEVGLKKPGAIEFAQAFDEAARGRHVTAER